MAVLVLLLGLAVVGAAGRPAEATPLARARTVVVLGVDGLDWSMVTPVATPRLAALAARSDVGLLAGRGADERTTVLDGWATLSAGGRARAGPLPDPAGGLGGGTDPGVAIAQRRTSGSRSGARVGALADAAGCVDASGGRGAALAGARSDGRSPATPGCPFRLIEAPGPAAAEQALAALDRSAAPDLLLVVGVGDPPSGRHLLVALLHRPSGLPRQGLVSASTGRAPYGQLVDVAPTVLAALGRPAPSSMSGQPLRAEGAAPTRAALLAGDQAARLMAGAVPTVVGLALAVVAAALVAAAVLARRGPRSSAARLVWVAAAVAAALPLACLLARLVPYERAGLPGLVPLVALLDIAVLVACRVRVSRVAALTLAGYVIDLATGGHLQLHSVLGYSALVAGRFQGVGNPGSGVLLAATLLTAGAVAGRFATPRSGCLAAGTVGLVGLVADGWPTLGSDLGGALALAPALVLLVGTLVRLVRAPPVRSRGVRPRARLLVAAVAAGLLAGVVPAAVDLSRPAGSRTHLGRFADDLLHGRAGTTLARKASADLDLLTASPASAAVPLVLLGVGVLLVRAGHGRGPSSLAAALRADPLLAPTTASCLVAGLLGMLLNDSGAAVAATLLLLVVPAVVQATVRPLCALAGTSRTRALGVPRIRTGRVDVPWAPVGSPVGRARRAAEDR